MSPERLDKLHSILRLATRLSDDERTAYIAAMTKDDDELRGAVDAYFVANPVDEPTVIGRQNPVFKVGVADAGPAARRP